MGSKRTRVEYQTLLPPLCDVDWLYDPRNFIHKGYGSSDVVEHRHISDLFPWHWHVFQQLQHCMGHVLEGTVKQKQVYRMKSGETIVKEIELNH